MEVERPGIRAHPEQEHEAMQREVAFCGPTGAGMEHPIPDGDIESASAWLSRMGSFLATSLNRETCGTIARSIPLKAASSCIERAIRSPPTRRFCARSFRSFRRK